MVAGLTAVGSAPRRHAWSTGARATLPSAAFPAMRSPAGESTSAEVTDEELEQVVAENPEITGMRLALAERYFVAGEFDRAVDHYLVVLEQDPENVAALAAVGWMTHLSGSLRRGATYVERALAIEPDYAQGVLVPGQHQGRRLGRPGRRGRAAAAPSSGSRRFPTRSVPRRRRCWSEVDG